MKKIAIIGHSLVVSAYQDKYYYLAKILGGKARLWLFPPFYFYEGGRLTYLEKKESEFYQIKPLKPIFPYKPYLYYLLDIKRELKKLQPDLVIIWEEPISFLTYQLSSFLKRNFPTMKIIGFSAENLERDYPFPFSFFYRCNLELIDGWFVVNEGARKIIKKKVKNKNICLVPLGISEVHFRTISDFKARFLKRRKEKKLTFLFVGRLNQQKNPLAFLKVASFFPNSHFILVGDGPLRKEVEMMLRKNFSGRYVYFPQLSLFQMPLIYQQADFLILPFKETATKREQFSRVVIEGMASGVIPFFSSEGEMNLFFGEEFCYGRSFQLENLSKKIKSTLKEKDYAFSLLEKIENLVEKYSWQRISRLESEFIFSFL